MVGVSKRLGCETCRQRKKKVSAQPNATHTSSSSINGLSSVTSKPPSVRGVAVQAFSANGRRFPAFVSSVNLFSEEHPSTGAMAVSVIRLEFERHILVDQPLIGSSTCRQSCIGKHQKTRPKSWGVPTRCWSLRSSSLHQCLAL